MDENWISDARQRLLALRQPSGGWGYRKRTSPAIEPTSLAALSLLNTDREVSRAAGDWLVSIRNRDGSLGISRDLTKPCWPTPHACLLWAALDEHQVERSAAIEWLLRTKGTQIPRVERSPIGHDTQLVGWPWIEGTHSWVEPTAMALLVLARKGMRQHPRALEGLRVLRDRAIPTGGWNIGNPRAFGTPLRAHPSQTGLALLALAEAGWAHEPTVAPAISFLKKALAETLAPASLSWGILGLRAWETAPPRADEWLAKAYDRISDRTEDATALALLLLAAGERSLDHLGIIPRESWCCDEV